MQASVAKFRPIDSLRLFSFSNNEPAAIRGVVILTSPVLIVQDSTGGISIPNAKPLP